MYKKITSLICLLIIVSCSKEIDLSQLVERNGLFYEINNEKPFNGTTLSYHPNGQIKSRIEYKNGLKEGLSETFNENGQIIESVNYKENLLNGLSKSFYGNGQLIVKVILKNGLPVDGQVEYFFKNGSINERSNYKDGQYDGLVELYYEDGTPKSIRNYKDGKLNGLFESFYENGTFRSKANYKDGQYDGLVELYYEDGTPKSIRNYKDGKLNGLFESFYEDGAFRSKENYKDGQYDGLSEYFYEDGSLKTKVNYEDGTERFKERYYEINKSRPILELRETFNKEGEVVLSEGFHKNGRLEHKKSWEDDGSGNLRKTGTWISNIYEDERIVFIKYIQKDGRTITEFWEYGEINTYETNCYEKDGWEKCEVPEGFSYRNGEEPYFFK